jgi:hypothetical protein
LALLQALLSYNNPMKLSLNKLKLKQDIDRFEVLHWGVFFFLLLGGLYQTLSSGAWFYFLFQVVFFSLYFFFLRKLLRGLYYSFWTFTGFLSLFLIFKIFTSSFWEFSFFSFLTSLALLFTEAYLLWTPIFYPVVSWWEYDFRYRDDLKVKVTIDGETVDGRLTDLRRGAGCVAVFKEVKIGKEVLIEPFESFQEVSFKAEVMSKRQYSLGRPHNYGVKFEVENDEALFNQFCMFWKNERRAKLLKKFKNEEG